MRTQDFRERRTTNCYQCGKIILSVNASRRKAGGNGDLLITCGRNCERKRVRNRKLIKRKKS